MDKMLTMLSRNEIIVQGLPFEKKNALCTLRNDLRDEAEADNEWLSFLDKSSRRKNSCGA